MSSLTNVRSMGAQWQITEVQIGKIVVQPDKYKPTSLAPVELEHLRPKRHKIDIAVSQGSKRSVFLAVIEFRGRTLVVTRKSGSYSATELVRTLEDAYFDRFQKECMIPPFGDRDDVCECTLNNAREFSDFLHLLKGRGLSMVQG